MFNKSVPGRDSLEDLAPVITDTQILFPVSASSVYIHEDGRSFGYPVDDGWVTNIEYDFTVGALTEDTIALSRSLKKPITPANGVHPIDVYDFTDAELNEWRVGLDVGWAEEQYNTWLKKGLVDEGETKEQFVQNLLDCYHSWPQEWRSVYNSSWEKLNAPVGARKTILINDALTLYSDDAGDYFFSTRYHDHGAITKANKEAALEYIEEYEVYQAALKEHGRKLQLLKENLDLLKNTLN